MLVYDSVMLYSLTTGLQPTVTAYTSCLSDMLSLSRKHIPHFIKSQIGQAPRLDSIN